jgi:hypothetical protein
MDAIDVSAGGDVVGFSAGLRALEELPDVNSTAAALTRAETSGGQVFDAAGA